MATLDIRGTVVGETAIAIKAPYLVATTGANITLSGVQAIDGVTVGNNSERVLVKDQTMASQNGIYIASTGARVLAADWTNNNNVALGTLVLVTSGGVNQGTIFEQLCTDNPVVIGTSFVAFAPLPNQTAQAATSTASLTIGTGSKTLTIQSGKAFAANQYVVIYETSNVANAMLAQVTSYSGTSLVVNVIATGGSGMHADWSIVLTNSPAGAGIIPPMGSGNVTGPGSATAGHVATFADGTGKVIQDGGAAGIPSAAGAAISRNRAADGKRHPARDQGRWPDFRPPGIEGDAARARGAAVNQQREHPNPRECLRNKNADHSILVAPATHELIQFWSTDKATAYGCIRRE
jgi:hypothetical protein